MAYLHIIYQLIVISVSSCNTWPAATVCPDARAVSVLTLALKRLNISALNLEYSLKIYPHIDELGPLLRPPVYGLLARFASQNNCLKEAAGYLLKVPKNQRRQVPFCEVAKYCVGERRPDLVLSLLSASPLKSISPELIGHAIASLTVKKFYIQSLSYESLLLNEMRSQNRFLPWVVPFLLTNTAQLGQCHTAMDILNNYYQVWNKTPSELDYNLIIFSILKAGMTITSESDIILNFGILFKILHKMKILKYGLHPVVRDFDSFHPMIPLGFGDYFKGVKMALSSLPSVANPCASITDIIYDGNDFNQKNQSSATGIEIEEKSDNYQNNFSLMSTVRSDAKILDLNQNLKPNNENLNLNNQKKDEIDGNKIDIMLTDLNFPSPLEESSLLRNEKNIVNDENRNNGNQNLRINYDDKNKLNSPYVTRVWTPTTSKVIVNENADLNQKKIVKKIVSWPLNSNFMLRNENFVEDIQDENFNDDNDNDEDGDDAVQGERDSGRDGSRNRDREGEGENNVEGEGDYFDDADWLRRKTNFVNFSPNEVEEMRLMETLDLHSKYDDENDIKYEKEFGRETNVMSDLENTVDRNSYDNDVREEDDVILSRSNNG